MQTNNDEIDNYNQAAIDYSILNLYETFEYTDMNKNFAVVSKSNKFGLINNKLNTLLPCEYDKIVILNPYILSICKQNKWGLCLCDLQNAFVTIFPQYDEIRLIESKDFWCTDTTYFLVRKNHKWGVINRENHLVIPFEYDKFDISKLKTYIYTEFIVAYSKDKCGIIDFKNNIILPLEYDDIRINPSKQLEVKQNGDWSVSDVNISENIPNV